MYNALMCMFSHVHHHQRTVVDFEYMIDLMHFVAAQGDIDQPFDKINAYLQSSAKVRTLCMYKSLEWNEERFRTLVMERIRQLGYPNTIHVNIDLSYSEVKIYDPSDLTKCCMSNWTVAFSWILCFCPFRYCFLGVCQDDFRCDCKFKMIQSADEIFYAIQSQIHK
jgi:hypothetical protein